MFINNISLVNYRNFKRLNIKFDTNTNIFIGSNAQGKTNLLESIYYLSLLKSYRSINNKDIIFFNSEFSKIIANVSLQRNREIDLEVVLYDIGKRLKINDVIAKKISEFVGSINVVMFTPDDLALVKGSPKLRRKFMDVELSKLFPSYLYHLGLFNHLLKERNKYLKVLNDKNKKSGDDYLDVLTEQLIDTQIHLYKKRKKFVELISEMSNDIYGNITSDKMSINLVYESFIDVDNKELIMQKYKKSLFSDIRKAQTQYGIHKDDIDIYIDNRKAIYFGSQGQQRTIVLSMKIALIHYIHKELKEFPILLLDDVLSELDDERKNKLLDLIDDRMQTFITTTSIEKISHKVIKNAKKYYISNGMIVNSN